MQIVNDTFNSNYTVLFDKTFRDHVLSNFPLENHCTLLNLSAVSDIKKHLSCHVPKEKMNFSLCNMNGICVSRSQICKLFFI